MGDSEQSPGFQRVGPGRRCKVQSLMEREEGSGPSTLAGADFPHSKEQDGQQFPVFNLKG